MKLLHRAFLSLAAAAALAACAASSTDGAGGAPHTRRDPDLITREEIVEVGATNALDLVRTHRPRWLKRRGLGTARTVVSGQSVSPMQSAIVVYLDDVALGDEMSLRGINLTTVVSMRYLDAPEATQRFGTGHPAGAILVSTRERG